MSGNKFNEVITSLVALETLSLNRNIYGITEDQIESMKQDIFTLINAMVENNIQTDTGAIVEPPRRVPPVKKFPATKTLSKKRLEEACPCQCVICNETPTFQNAVYTECGHYYCGVCWESWMNSYTSNKKCPTCRKDRPKTTSYQARANRKQQIA
jgi:hypothetical protein